MTPAGGRKPAAHVSWGQCREPALALQGSGDVLEDHELRTRTRRTSAGASDPRNGINTPVSARPVPRAGSAAELEVAAGLSVGSAPAAVVPVPVWDAYTATDSHTIRFRQL